MHGIHSLKQQFLLCLNFYLFFLFFYFLSIFYLFFFSCGVRDEDNNSSVPRQNIRENIEYSLNIQCLRFSLSLLNQIKFISINFLLIYEDKFQRLNWMDIDKQHNVKK